MTTDHYENAVRLLANVGNVADAEDRRQCLMEAQVYVGLAGVDETRRMSALMNGVDEALSELKAADTRTIPWPPSDELVERVAAAVYTATNHFPKWGDIGDGEHAWWRVHARAVLDAIGGGTDDHPHPRTGSHRRGDPNAGRVDLFCRCARRREYQYEVFRPLGHRRDRPREAGGAGADRGDARRGSRCADQLQ